MTTYPAIIGRAENIDIVDTALGVPAKIDTGAFRSAIHAQKIKIVKRGGQPVLTCELLGHPVSPVPRPFESSEFTELPVKNSTGNVEVRYEVKMKIKIGPKVFLTSFSLSDRSNNIYPVLVGRKALKDRFLVDVSKTSINRLELKKLKGVTSAEDEEDLE